MAEESFCDYLEKYSTISSQSAQESRECHDFNAYFSFEYQLFEDESELNNIQSSVIVGSICKKSTRFNASRNSSKTSLS